MSEILRKHLSGLKRHTCTLGPRCRALQVGQWSIWCHLWVDADSRVNMWEPRLCISKCPLQQLHHTGRSRRVKPGKWTGDFPSSSWPGKDRQTRKMQKFLEPGCAHMGSRVPGHWAELPLLSTPTPDPPLPLWNLSFPGSFFSLCLSSTSVSQVLCSSSFTNLFSPTPMTSVITYMLLPLKSEPLSRALSLNTATEFSSQTGNTVSNSWPVPSPVSPILINESIDTLKSLKPAI